MTVKRCSMNAVITGYGTAARPITVCENLSPSHQMPETWDEHSMDKVKALPGQFTFCHITALQVYLLEL